MRLTPAPAAGTLSLTMEYDVSEIRRALERRPEVAAAYLFGSAAKGGMRKDSDVDVAILTVSGLSSDAEWKLRLDLMGELSSIARREVDVVVLNRASLLLRYSVYRANATIFERDPAGARMFKVWSLSRWFDFEPQHTRYCRLAMRPMIERAGGHG